MKKYIFLAALAILAVFSCKEETAIEESAINLSGVSEEGFYFSSVKAESAVFQIWADENWTIAVKDLDWLSVSVSDGDAKTPADVVLKAEDNDEASAREGFLTVRAGNATRKIKVSQEAGLPWTNASVYDVEFEPVPEAPVTVTISSNVPWTISKEDLAWCEIEPASGDAGETQVTFTASINEGDAREGKAKLKATGTEAAIRVAQAKVIPYFTADKNSEEFSFEGGTKTISTASNQNWTVTSSASWLTVSPASGGKGEVAVTISAPANDGPARNATVTFTIPGLESYVVAVTQAEMVFDPVVLSQWTLSNEKDATAFSTQNPGWIINGTKGTYNNSGVINSDDGKNTAEWFAAHTTPLTAPDSYFRTNYSSGLAVNGLWKGDGFRFHVKNVTADAGRKIVIYTGIRAGNKQALAKWTVKMSTDGDKTWKEGVGTIYSGLVPVERLTGTGRFDFVGTIELTEPLKNQDITVFVCTREDSDIITDGSSLAATSAATSVAYTIRFELLNSMWNDTMYPGPTVVLE